VVGGFSSLIDPINVVSRVGGVATYTCVMKHTLRVGDVVIVNSFSNPTFNGSLTVISTPDAFRFTANTGGPDVLPGLYLDGQVIMLRSQRIFATGCEFKYNRVQGGPNPVDQQSPVTAITVREANGADISYNNFDGFRGTCFYVDSY
jgi:signal peptidase I